MPQNFLYPQRDQPLLLPVDMREWLPEDDLVFVILDAVATLDLGELYRRVRADGHGRAAFDPEMMVALLLYGYCQGERSSRVIERRCVRDVGYRVVGGGLRPDHATIARFRARHQQALGVLRLLAAEGMVSLGVLSLDGTKLAGNAAQKANKRLPQIEKLLAEAAAVDAAEDAEHGSAAGPVTPRTLARRAERRERLAAARDRLAAEDQARRDAQRAKQQAWDAAAAAGKHGGRRPGDEPPRTNHNNTEPRANITGPDVRVMRNQKGYVAGYNGQLVVTAQQVIAGAMLSRHPVDRTLLHPCWRPAASSWPTLGSGRSCAPCSPALGMPARRTSPALRTAACGCSRHWPKTPAGAASVPRNGPGIWTGFRPPPEPNGACSTPAAGLPRLSPARPSRGLNSPPRRRRLRPWGPGRTGAATGRAPRSAAWRSGSAVTTAAARVAGHAVRQALRLMAKGGRAVRFQHRWAWPAADGPLHRPFAAPGPAMGIERCQSTAITLSDRQR